MAKKPDPPTWWIAVERPCPKCEGAPGGCSECRLRGKIVGRVRLHPSLAGDVEAEEPVSTVDVAADPGVGP